MSAFVPVQTLQEKLAAIADGRKNDHDDSSSDHDLLMSNPFYNDNKTLVAMMTAGDVECRQAIFSTADVLGITKKHKIEVFYYGAPNGDLLEMCRSSYSYLRKAMPERYDYTIKYQTLTDGGKRPVVNGYLKENRPKFVVLGLREGMTPELLDDAADISYRQCLGSTPIICKKRFVFKKHGKGSDSHKKYESLTYAFYVDWSEDAFHAFNLMVDHFRSGDTAHFIWVKPNDEEIGGGGDAQSLNVIFQRYLKVIQGIEAEMDVHTHISSEPNVGQFLVSFANNKKNAVDFLVVYCDLMGVYAKGNDLIGSISDWAVKFCQCPVVIPKLPTF